jgi:SAM-dependent methyltransferase
VPVIWGGRSGNGRVLVSAIEPDGGPADALLAVLLGRTLEWGAGVGPSLKLPSDAPWLSSDAAWDGRGFLPGLPEREGFFMGRQIAPFMSYLGADWLTRPDREEAEQPERVLDELKVAPGSAVADLGAGNGYFTLRLARRVGASGRVLAVEIQQEMLDLLKIRMEKEALKNIDLVLSTENDPRLAPASVDLVLMVDVYHELSDPRAVLATVRKALRPKGRIALVEYRGEDPGVQIKPAHRTTEAQVRGELRALGFRWLRTHEFLRNQRILEFAAQE